MEALANIFTEFGEHIEQALNEASSGNNAESVRHLIVVFKGDRDEFIVRSCALYWAANYDKIELITTMLEFSNDKAGVIDKSEALIEVARYDHVDSVKLFVDS